MANHSIRRRHARLGRRSGQTVEVIVLVVVLAVVVALGALAAVTYNRVQRARNGVPEAWAQVDTMLQRRADLIGRLAAIAGAAAAHERSTLPAVIAERDSYERAMQADGAQLLARAESYPQLHADQTFRQLSDELVRTEDDISAARRYYNGRVKLYNVAIAAFPGVLLANRMDLRAAEYFQIDLDEKVAPRVS